MNIDPQNNPSHIQAQNQVKPGQGAAGHPAAAGKAPAAAAGDRIELSALESLRSQPEVGPDVVAKGKELLNDPDFPSPQMVHQMAKLITPFADGE